MVCVKCNEDKSSEDFYKKTSRSSGLQSYCKNCHNVYSKKYYKTNRTSHISKKVKRDNEIRAWIVVLKSKPCLDCKNSYHPTCMDFDHKGGKLFNIAEAVRHGYSKDIILEEIVKCDLICANCHRLRTYNRRNT